MHEVLESEIFRNSIPAVLGMALLWRLWGLVRATLQHIVPPPGMVVGTADVYPSNYGVSYIVQHIVWFDNSYVLHAYYIRVSLF